MKKYLGIIIILIISILVIGCKKSSDDENTNTEQANETIKSTEEDQPTDETEEVPDGQSKSRLTGLFVAEETALSRPYAIMLNNIKEANPQSGIKEAAILYEALAEGGITRHMGVYEDLHPERIGSVRSGRQYFASIADEYDAIFVSFGESSYCSDKIKELGLNQLSGLRGEGSKVFYRDKTIKAPHNAFTSNERIADGTSYKKFRTEYDTNLKNHFTFYNKDSELETEQNVEKVTIKFSSPASPYFTYDADSKTYLRYQFKDKHTDANSGDQLEFKNLIIQFVDGFSEDGLRSFSFKKASGVGFFVSNGKAIPITWDKSESSRSMVYYGPDEAMLKINPGKTYIAIFPSNRKSDVMFE